MVHLCRRSHQSQVLLPSQMPLRVKQIPQLTVNQHVHWELQDRKDDLSEWF